MDQVATNHPVLSCKEVNQQGALPSILLIHGAFSSSDEWNLVVPHLSSSYHLLLPDLPGHGDSKNITPFSKTASADMLANLVREKALDGKANVIGLSLGAHVAIELASKRPEVVNSVFASGYEVFPPSQSMAYGLWLSNRIESSIPRPLVRWLMDGADIRPSASPPSLALSDEVARAICVGDEDCPAPWPARTLIVAAGKAGTLPTADHPEDARRLWDIGWKMNEGTRAYMHPDMRHPWNRQAPELFAETARRWFEEGSVPDGFTEL